MGFKIRYLWAEITGRKNRSMFMIGGLSLGVALWLCLYTLAGAYEQAAAVPLRQLGTDLTIQKSQGPIPEKFEGAILPCADAQIDGLAAAQVRDIPGVEKMTEGLLLWVFDSGMDNANDFKMVLGMDPAADFGPGVLKSGVASGRYLTPADSGKALLDENYAAKQGVQAGKMIKIADRIFEVIGVVKTPSSSLLGTTNVYIPLADAQDIAKNASQIEGFQSGDINLIFIKADPSRVTTIQTAVKAIMPDVTVSTPTSFLAMMGGFAEAARRLALIGTVIAIIAALAMAVRTTASTIWERRRDIAIMKAVGWTNNDVRQQIMAENLVLGLAGGAVGLLASVAFVWAMNGQIITIPLPWELDPYPHFYMTGSADKMLTVPLDVRLSWGLSLAAIVSGMAIALLTIVFVARRIMGIKPAEVLRSE
ncbi:MAG: ABC transporter permease [Negativicutes bacterium]|nr:ABC transporter permease [Negativicutes bacterium]